MIVSVGDLRNYMSGIELSEAQEAAAEDVLAGVQNELELYLNRPVEVAARTESVYPSASGLWFPSVTPVVSINSVDTGDYLLESTSYLLDGYDTALAGYSSVTFRTLHAGPLAVTYMGGLDGPNIAALRLFVLRVAAREMENKHDDVVSAKDLDTKDVPELEEGPQEADYARVQRYRRRVAV